MNEYRVLALLEKVHVPKKMLAAMRQDIVTKGAENVFAEFLASKDHKELKEISASVIFSYKKSENFWIVITKMMQHFSGLYPEFPELPSILERTLTDESFDKVWKVRSFTDPLRNDAARKNFLTEHFRELMTGKFLEHESELPCNVRPSS